MDVILNIGLKSDTLGDISVVLAKQMLWAADLLIKSERLVQSDTEPTLVVEVTSVNGPTLTLSASPSTGPRPRAAPWSARRPPPGAASTPSFSSCPTAPAWQLPRRKPLDQPVAHATVHLPQLLNVSCTTSTPSIA